MGPWKNYPVDYTKTCINDVFPPPYRKVMDNLGITDRDVLERGLSKDGNYSNGFVKLYVTRDDNFAHLKIYSDEGLLVTFSADGDGKVIMDVPSK